MVARRARASGDESAGIGRKAAAGSGESSARKGAVGGSSQCRRRQGPSGSSLPRRAMVRVSQRRARRSAAASAFHSAEGTAGRRKASSSPKYSRR